MRAITINELYNHLKKQIDGGMGNKKILIATDEDGNEYRGLHRGISELLVSNATEFPIEERISKENLSDYVVLG